MDAWKIERTIELARPPVFAREQPYLLMVPGDEKAHEWIITVLLNGEPANLTGMTASGVFMRHDNTIVTCSGANATITDNVVTVKFRAECYNVPGGMRGAVRISGAAGTVTLADQAFYVQKGFDGQTVTDEYIPTLPQLLANVSRLEQANNLSMVLLATNGITSGTVTNHVLDLGYISLDSDDAYEAAQAAGYTGTEEEWDAFMAAVTNNTALITQANNNASAAITTANSKADVTSATVKALASGWSSGSAPYTQTVSCSIATASNNLIVGVGGTLTSEQKAALDAANIVCTGQGNGTITLTVYGTKPEVDLPINVLGVN